MPTPYWFKWWPTGAHWFDFMGRHCLGLYVVHVGRHGYFACVDDFGNLVQVEVWL